MAHHAETLKAESLALRRRILGLMTVQPGIHAHEVAANLGIAKSTATRHMAAIRDGWRPDDDAWQSIGDLARKMVGK